MAPGGAAGRDERQARRGVPPAQAAPEDGEEAHDVLAEVARAPAQRPLRGARQARGLPLARRLQAPRDRRQASPPETRWARRRSGAAPGGWSQVAADKVGSREGRGRVVGIDLLPIEPLPGAEFVTLDFLDPDAPERLTALIGGPADLVLSDMAANATGHKKTDHLRIIGLAEAAADFARSVLGRPAAPSWPRCCRAAPRARSSPIYSATSRRSTTSSPPPAAPLGRALRARDRLPRTHPLTLPPSAEEGRLGRSPSGRGGV